MFCDAKEGCGGGGPFGACWLKHAADPNEPRVRASGAAVPWISGARLTVSAQEHELRRRRARAARQAAPLTVLHAEQLAVGLRNETATLELLTPRGEGADPALSYTLPLLDEENAAVIRSDKHLRKLCGLAGLELSHTELQGNFPKDLHPVRMYWLTLPLKERAKKRGAAGSSRVLGGCALTGAFLGPIPCRNSSELVVS